jgi:hypothetical protein
MEYLEKLYTTMTYSIGIIEWVWAAVALGLAVLALHP